MTETTRMHKLLDRPLLGTFLLYGFMILVMIVPQLIKNVLGLDETTAGYLLTILAIAPMLFVAEFVFTKIWFRGEFDGTLSLDHVVDGLKMTLVPLAVNVILFLVDRIILAPDAPMNNILMVIAISMNAGFMEEAWFRSYAVANFMRIKRSYGGMLFAIVLTSLVFGAAHLPNVLAGANASRTVQQFVTATITGVFFAAIYLRCGNILPCMLYHCFHDIINLMFMATNSSGAMLNASSITDLIVQVIYSGAELIVAIWLIRPATFEGIRSLWDRKWHLQQQEADDSQA